MGYAISVEYIDTLPILTISIDGLTVGQTGYVNVFNADQSTLCINFTVTEGGTGEGGETTVAPNIIGLTNDMGTLSPDSGTTNEYSVTVNNDMPATVILLGTNGRISEEELKAVQYTISPEAGVIVKASYWDAPYFDIFPNGGSVGGVVDVTINNPDGSTIVIHCTVA